MKLLVIAALLSVSFNVSAQQQFDVPALCKSSEKESFEYTLKYDFQKEPDYLFGKSPAELAGELVSAYQSSEMLSSVPWLLQDATRPQVLDTAQIIQMQLAQKLIDRFQKDVSPRKIFEQSVQKPAVYSKAALKQADEAYKIYKKGDYDNKLDQVKLVAGSLCKPYKVDGCATALRKVINIMKPRVQEEANFFASHPRVLKQIFGNPDLVQGLSQYSLRVMDYLEKGIPLGKNLFDDLKDSFRDFHSDEKVVEELTWTAITFYATRGAAVGYFQSYMNAENFPTLLSMYVIGSALGRIDYDYSSRGTYYSYPSEIQSTCAMARPYHFWLAASLVRDLIADGVKPKAAVFGVHTMSKLYELQSGSYGRDGLKYFREEFFNWYSVAAQVGIAHKTIGALWAAKLAPDFRNVNQSLEQIFSKSKPLPVLPEKENQKLSAYDPATMYKWFHHVVAPDAGFPAEF